jgi:hypothetical protein
MADFMVRAGYPFLYGEMVRVESDTPAIEAIEALKKDIEKTAAQMEQVHELLSTVDINDNVIHLKNDEKNLSNVFGDAYDSKNKIINFSNYSLKITQVFEREDFLNEITNSLVGQSYSDFREMFRARNKTFKLDDKSLYTDEDKIYFLSVVKDREKYSKVVDKIRGFGEGFGKYRSKLSLEEKNQIDNEITFNRSMIDSVTLSSTYLTKEDGIVKLGTPHKKEMSNINEIVKFLKDNDFIKAIELDPETSLEGVISVLNKSKEINFNLDNEIVFKVRKLGNYKASGLYLNSQKIVAVDIKNPSAAIHEFVHAVDLGRDDIRHSQQREDIASKYRSKIDAEKLPEGSKGYYLKTNEIIARLGEIGYLLNQHDFKESESVVDFELRVNLEEKTDKPYDLNLAKPINTYLNKMGNEYFNVKEMSKSDLLEVKSYYQSYFGVRNNEIRPINLIEVNPDEKKAHVVRQLQRHQLKPVSFFKPDNIKFALDYNKNEKVIDFNKLFGAIFESPVDVSRSVKKYDHDTLSRQKSFFGKLGEWVVEENNPYLTSLALKSLHTVDRNSNPSVALVTKNAFLNNERFVAEEMFPDEFTRLKDIKKEQEDFLLINKKPEARYSEPMRALRSENSGIISKVRSAYRKIENEKFPELNDAIDKKSDAYTTERTASGNRSKSLNSGASATLFSIYREKLVESMESLNPIKVLSCFEKDELMLFDLLTNENLRSRVFKKMDMGHNQIGKILQSGMQNGLVSSLVNNDNGGYQGFNVNMSGYSARIDLGETITTNDLLVNMLPENLVSELASIKNCDDKIKLIELNVENEALNKSDVENFKSTYVFETESNKIKNDLRSFVNKKETKELPPATEERVSIKKVDSINKKSSSNQLKLF